MSKKVETKKKLEFSQKVMITAGIVFTVIAIGVGIATYFGKNLLDFFKEAKELFRFIFCFLIGKNATENVLKIKSGSVISQVAEKVGIEIQTKESDSNVESK